MLFLRAFYVCLFYRVFFFSKMLRLRFISWKILTNWMHEHVQTQSEWELYFYCIGIILHYFCFRSIKREISWELDASSQHIMHIIFVYGISPSKCPLWHNNVAQKSDKLSSYKICRFYYVLSKWNHTLNNQHSQGVQEYQIKTCYPSFFIERHFHLWLHTFNIKF